MNKRKLLSFFRKFLSSSGSIIILSLIALAFFIIGELRQIILFQGLAGVLGGTVLTLFVTNITGREAVSQQNAKEANITRKYTYYIPIFNELKQLHDIMDDAKQKRLPYPQWINGVDSEQRASVWGKYPMPTFATWTTFKEQPYRSNFTEKACILFDEVQAVSAKYNQAVSHAKDPVINIVNPKLDNVLRDWGKSHEFKQWSEETKGGTSWSTVQYHEWNSYIYKYLQRPNSSPPEALAFVWAFNILGWVLVNNIDEASDSMHHVYQYDFSTHNPPDTVWFKSILESVWTELQELDCVKTARTAAGELLEKTIQAKEYMQERLNYIRDMYEGGEPPL